MAGEVSQVETRPRRR